MHKLVTYPPVWSRITMEFGRFMDENPTIFHFTNAIERYLDSEGFSQLDERDLATVVRKGKYYISRNGSNLIAFVVGEDFIPGPDGFAVVVSHIDANKLTLKPTSVVSKPTELGIVGLGSAPYASGGNPSWWDRDLGLGGRVIVRTKNGVASKLVRLPGIIGSIPHLAEHFGPLARDVNPETREVPLIGIFTPDTPTKEELKSPLAEKHPIELVRAVAKELDVKVADIVEWELELFSAETAKIGGLNGEFLYCSRMDDRLCSYAAIKGLVEATRRSDKPKHSCQIVALYDDEEIGSELRTGARNKLLDVTIGHIVQSLYGTLDDKRQAMANSFNVSADVTHAAHPNYPDSWVEGLAPKLNTGLVVKRLGRFSSDAVDTAACRLVSEAAGQTLQVFSPRNDTLSGGTIGQIVASITGIRTVDVGIPILAMHSIREMTGSRDVSLGINWFRKYFLLSDTMTKDIHI